VNGKFVAIEAKAGKGVATALQLKNLAQINNAGGYICIINETNLDHLKNIIAECMQ
jgi:hypothetical protein